MSVTATPLQPVKTSHKVWLWLGILAAVALALGLAWWGTRAVVAAKGDEATYLAWNKSQVGVQETASGLQYQILERGAGPNAKDGDVATVSIEGRLRDGTVFQPRAGGPFPVQPFNPSQPTAIPGFTEALKLMNEGARYRVWIPAKLAYDAMPDRAPPELKGQLLMFDMEISDIMGEAEMREMQMRQMMQQQQMQQQQQQMQGGGPEGPAPQGPPPEGAAPQGAPKGP